MKSDADAARADFLPYPEFCVPRELVRELVGDSRWFKDSDNRSESVIDEWTLDGFIVAHD